MGHGFVKGVLGIVVLVGNIKLGIIFIRWGIVTSGVCPRTVQMYTHAICVCVCVCVCLRRKHGVLAPVMIHEAQLFKTSSAHCF